ncbi:aspartic peptidase domain-containing protein [Mycena rosella]|uniref:Aspartic peptidase domain-containing protein n=1 Tax=Mycena rosella TaxID=1033263 RepID=A0AAD7DLC1_MYCRO|nr:aspartic peptidase domain-containing protein [Mycena rosella]
MVVSRLAFLYVTLTLNAPACLTLTVWSFSSVEPRIVMIHLSTSPLLLNTPSVTAVSASTGSMKLSPAASINFPLVRRTGRPMTTSDYLTMAAKSGTFSEQHRISRRQDLTLKGDDHIHPDYFVNIGIGTPPQTPAVLVAQDTCSNCTGSSTLYNSAASTTFFQLSNNITTLSYSSGAQVSGTVVRDTLQLGSYTIASQAFLKAEKLTSSLLSGPEAGILGLSFKPLHGTMEAPAWQVALGQAVTPEMAFWLKRGAQHETFGGAFTFGGSLFQGDIEFLPVPSNSNGPWQLNVAGIGGPAVDVKAIWATVPDSTALTYSPGSYEYRA